jgi:hypothetical protein
MIIEFVVYDKGWKTVNFWRWLRYIIKKAKKKDGQFVLSIKASQRYTNC